MFAAVAPTATSAVQGHVWKSGWKNTVNSQFSTWMSK